MHTKKNIDGKQKQRQLPPGFARPMNREKYSKKKKINLEKQDKENQCSSSSHCFSSSSFVNGNKNNEKDLSPSFGPRKEICIEESFSSSLGLPNLGNIQSCEIIFSSGTQIPVNCDRIL